MPELPEVEVTRRTITEWLVDRRISGVLTTRASYFFLTRPGTLRRALVGRTVRCLERRGKYLLAGLDDGRRLLLHLGMTGQLFSQQASSVRLPELRGGSAADRHTHLRLVFEDGGPDVLFRDVRKFGKVRLLAPGQSDPRLDRLGVDALQARGADLYRATRGRSVAIKSLLLDQSVLAGIGNIYADEGLFLAGVRPTRRAGRLTRSECERLVDAVARVLRRSIETGGSTISDYIAADGRDGGYQDERHVYARGGEPCLHCGSPIRRRVIGQRSTCYCPACQR